MNFPVGGHGEFVSGSMKSDSEFSTEPRKRAGILARNRESRQGKEHCTVEIVTRRTISFSYQRSSVWILVYLHRRDGGVELSWVDGRVAGRFIGDTSMHTARTVLTMCCRKSIKTNSPVRTSAVPAGDRLSTHSDKAVSRMQTFFWYSQSEALLTLTNVIEW